MHDWASSPHRPLPRPVVPVLDETIESYLQRLAAANRLDSTALRIHITGSTRKAAPVPLAVLSLLSGQRAQALRFAILELNTVEEMASMEIEHRPRPAGNKRRKCVLCARARGCSTEVWCWTHDYDVICLPHQRWVGNGGDHAGAGQPDLSAQPDILRANRRHRRLIRHYGRDATTRAFREANYICFRWHDRGEHREDSRRLMRIFHGDHWAVTSSNPTNHAARYPQVLELTRLLLSPFWSAKAQQDWPEPTEFVTEIRRTVAPRFHWTLNRRDDPLVALIVDRRSDHDPPVRRPCRTDSSTCLS